MLAMLLLLAAPFPLALLLGFESASKRIAPLLALLALPLPWLMPEAWVIPRALGSLAATLYFMRSLELSRLSETIPFTRRLWWLTSTFDARGTRAVKPSMQARELVTLVPWAVASTLVWWSFAQANQTLLLWAAGLVGFYCSVEAITRVTEIGYRAAGYHIPNVQLHPIFARSVSEFWGQRWNRPISGWLRSYCFLPIAKRGYANLGMAAAFLASTAIHFYFIWTALGLQAGLMMACFFLVQIPLVLLEKRLVIRRWPTYLAHAWTILVLTIASPLFVDPMLGLLGPR